MNYQDEDEDLLKAIRISKQEALQFVRQKSQENKLQPIVLNKGLNEDVPMQEEQKVARKV